MADAPLTHGTRLIDFAPAAVTDKLIRMQVGGCTCMTKSPEVRFHDERCTYRLAVEVQDLLNTAPAPQPPAAPLTPEQIVMDGLMMVPNSVCGDIAAVFEAGVRFAERRHGIATHKDAP